jgi:hypothetical protein
MDRATTENPRPLRDGIEPHPSRYQARRRHRSAAAHRYLGGITDRGIENLIHCCSFWDSVTAAFDELGDAVPPADRERFETAIADRVPRPSADAYKDAARQTAQRYGWESLSEGFKAVLAEGEWH